MTRAVTDILYRTDGSPWASAPVTFERKAGSFDDGSSWPPDEKQATTDATGAYSVQLWPDAAGSIRSRYHVTYPNGDVFYVSIPDGTTPISMPEIRVAAVAPPVPPSALSAHVAAPDPHAGYLLDADAAALYAPVVSPALTGTPTAPTAAGGTDTTQLATTAFVQAAVVTAGGGGDWSTITGTPTTLGGYGIIDAYTKGQVDTALGGKANAATTLAGYGITDAYTKAQLDTALGGKANAATTLAGYGITDAYTKTSSDARYAPIAHNQAWSTITGTPTTASGYGITDVYTQTQSNANLALKANLAGGNVFNDVQTLVCTTAVQVPLAVRGFTGQSGNLQVWQDSSAAVLARIASTGAFLTSGVAMFGALSGLSGAQVGMVAPTAGVIPLMVKGAASQTGDLQQWQDSGAAVLSRINKAGYFITHKNTLPADADLGTSDLAIWFDSTTGAAKVMFKGKNAAGTVVTGQVALT